MRVSHQTVRLSRGKHRSPEDGACVMELASMLANEPFSDRPRSVCPVIAAFMRIYNDRLDDDRRQDLYEWAARVVGTGQSSPAVLEARAEACEEFSRSLLPTWPRLVSGVKRRHADHVSSPSGAGVIAARAIRRITDETHLRALAHIEHLIALGAAEQSCSEAGVLARGGEDEMSSCGVSGGEGEVSSCGVSGSERAGVARG